MDISDIDVVIFNIYNYLNRPFIRFITEHNLKELEGARIHIFTLEDIENNFIPKLKQTKWVFDTKYGWSFITDEARCYLATQYKNCLYLDADAYLSRRYVKEMINSSNETILPGIFSETFSTNIFLSKNYGKGVLEKIYHLYEETENTEDYKLNDSQFITSKIPLSERLKIIQECQAPQPRPLETFHFGYGKFLHYYWYDLPKNNVVAYTTKDISIDSPLLDKYNIIWVIKKFSNTYMETDKSSKKTIYYLETGEYPFEKIIGLFLLDVAYAGMQIGVSPKFIDITNEIV